ncbi:hypothetical protein EVG20_g3381 [Dentipellis fragilis]|uniref:Uncharacterized protein n=1 Tax=Dentipellis fragilis TaxID=205917 RepID=A0A4Y9Z2M1_9AGAM|nr:hypothetical protein EVG20_g3381 [Dentipellis fragilis]
MHLPIADNHIAARTLGFAGRGAHAVTVAANTPDGGPHAPAPSLGSAESEISHSTGAGRFCHCRTLRATRRGKSSAPSDTYPLPSPSSSIHQARYPARIDTVTAQHLAPSSRHRHRSADPLARPRRSAFDIQHCLALALARASRSPLAGTGSCTRPVFNMSIDILRPLPRHVPHAASLVSLLRLGLAPSPLPPPNRHPTGDRPQPRYRHQSLRASESRIHKPTDIPNPITLPNSASDSDVDRAPTPWPLCTSTSTSKPTTYLSALPVSSLAGLASCFPLPASGATRASASTYCDWSWTAGQPGSRTQYCQ